MCHLIRSHISRSCIDWIFNDQRCAGALRHAEVFRVFFVVVWVHERIEERGGERDREWKRNIADSKSHFLLQFNPSNSLLFFSAEAAASSSFHLSIFFFSLIPVTKKISSAGMKKQDEKQKNSVASSEMTGTAYKCAYSWRYHRVLFVRLFTTQGYIFHAVRWKVE